MRRDAAPQQIISFHFANDVTMKDSLKKKIKSYSLLAAAVVLCNKETDAQIIYTDIDPDIDYSVNTRDFFYTLDLNKDEEFDFRFHEYYSISVRTYAGSQWRYLKRNFITVEKINSNSVLASNDLKFPIPLKLNDTINNTRPWISFGTLLSSNNGNFTKGLWRDLSGYLGLKIKIDNNSYYGWVRIEVYSAEYNYGFRIKDYAYNIQPDQPILAGQKSLCLPPVPTVTGADSTANQIELTACPATGYSYQWKMNGQNISGATSAEYIAKETGNFTVEITDKGGCSNNSDVFSFVSGINDISVKGNSFQSFLSNRTLFIKEISKKFIGGELQVFDVTGRKSAGQTITGSSEQLHLSSLPDGLYILELSKSGLKERRKFVLN